MVGDYQFMLFIINKGYIYIFTSFFAFCAENKQTKQAASFYVQQDFRQFFFKKEEEKQIQVDKWGTHSFTPWRIRKPIISLSRNVKHL